MYKKRQKVYNSLTNSRDNFIKKVTYRILTITKPKYVTLEKLNVKGMLKNKRLSSSIYNSFFNKFKEHFINKCQEFSIEVREVSTFFPSSKLCSNCGHKKEKLSLSERTYICEECGYSEDRDLNASINLQNATDYIILT